MIFPLILLHLSFFPSSLFSFSPFSFSPLFPFFLFFLHFSLPFFKPLGNCQNIYPCIRLPVFELVIHNFWRARPRTQRSFTGRSNKNKGWFKNHAKIKQKIKDYLSEVLLFAPAPPRAPMPTAHSVGPRRFPLCQKCWATALISTFRPFYLHVMIEQPAFLEHKTQLNK